MFLSANRVVPFAPTMANQYSNSNESINIMARKINIASVISKIQSHQNAINDLLNKIAPEDNNPLKKDDRDHGKTRKPKAEVKKRGKKVSEEAPKRGRKPKAEAVTEKKRGRKPREEKSTKEVVKHTKIRATKRKKSGEDVETPSKVRENKKASKVKPVKKNAKSEKIVKVKPGSAPKKSKKVKNK